VSQSHTRAATEVTSAVLTFVGHMHIIGEISTLPAAQEDAGQDTLGSQTPI